MGGNQCRRGRGAHLGIEVLGNRVVVIHIDRLKVLAGGHHAGVLGSVAEAREELERSAGGEVGAGAHHRQAVLILEMAARVRLGLQLEDELGKRLGLDARVEQRPHQIEDERADSAPRREVRREAAAATVLQLGNGMRVPRHEGVRARVDVAAPDLEAEPCGLCLGCALCAFVRPLARVAAVAPAHQVEVNLEVGHPATRGVAASEGGEKGEGVHCHHHRGRRR